jgi:putative two-component system response regulator
MLQAERGRAFDPHLVDLFLAQSLAMRALRDRINQAQPTFADLVQGVKLSCDL